jgi:hypothetical protein
MQGAKEQARSSTLRISSSAPAKTPARISNRNTSEFRISPNPNKTRRITLSNRNNNPHVAINFTSQSRDLTRFETSVISTTVPRTSNRQFFRPLGNLLAAQGPVFAAPPIFDPFWRLTPGQPFRETICSARPHPDAVGIGFTGSAHRSRRSRHPNRDMIRSEVPLYD